MTLYSSLVNFWQLSEASGSRADSVGSSTLTDNATVTSNTGLLYSNAAEFVIANSEYLSAADSAALSVGDIDWWCAAWVWFPSRPGNMAILSKYDTGTNKREYLLQVGSTAFSVVVSGDGTAPNTTTLLASTPAVPGNSIWHLVVAYHDSVNNLLGLSVDGGAFETTAHTTGVFDSNSEFRIGAAVSNGGTATYFGGRIGPVMIGKGYIPTAADVIYLYDSSTGITLAELAANSGHQTVNFRNLGDSLNPDINSGTDATSYANTSWTPPTTGLIVAFVHGARVAAADTPTISGNSLTWTQIGSTVGIANGRSISLFAANASGATAGATTVDFGGNTQLGCCASFIHVTGVDLSGGVAAAFVQSPNNTGTATSGSITLSAAGNSNNRPIAGFMHVSNEVKAPRTNWIEADDLAGAAHTRDLQIQWRHDAFETTASATWTTSSNWAGIAAELKATATAGAYTLTAAQGSYTLTGQTVNLLFGHKITIAQGSYTYTGQTVRLLRGYPLTAAVGTYALSGQAVTFKATRLLALGQGSYALTGQAVALKAARLLSVGQGSYTLAGQTVLLLRGYPLVAGTGSYSLTGQAVALKAARLLSLAQGSYTLSGQAVTLTYTPIVGYTLSIDAGTYTLSGQAVTLKATRLLSLAQGSYTLSGQTVTLVYTPLGAYVLSIDGGIYTLTGQVASLLAARKLTVAQGAYTFAGQTVALKVGRLLTVGQGSYALTGQALALRAGRLLALSQGAYSLGGQSAALLRGLRLPLAQGAYVLTGEGIAYLLARRLVTAQGAYVLSGQPLAFTWSGFEAPVTPDSRIYIVPIDDRSFVVPEEERIFAVA